MWWFGRRKRPQVSSSGTASTFVEATGGGWGDAPETIAADGGSQHDYVQQQLSAAYDYAVASGVPVGGLFEYTLTNIPRGISDPNEIVFGMMMQCYAYGLSCDFMHDERASFTRLW